MKQHKYEYTGEIIEGMKYSYELIKWRSRWKIGTSSNPNGHVYIAWGVGMRSKKDALKVINVCADWDQPYFFGYDIVPYLREGKLPYFLRPIPSAASLRRWAKFGIEPTNRVIMEELK